MAGAAERHDHLCRHGHHIAFADILNKSPSAINHNHRHWRYFDTHFPAPLQHECRIPRGRFGSTREIARTVAFLLSEGAGYITGQNLRVDGGIVKTV